MGQVGPDPPITMHNLFRLCLTAATEAARYDVSVDKMRKQLEEHDGLNPLAEQILLGKTLDFLKANVSVDKTEESTVGEEKS